MPRVQSVKETEGEGQQGGILAHIYLPLLPSYVLQSHWQLPVMLLEKTNSSQLQKKPLTVNESAKRHEPRKLLLLQGANYTARGVSETFLLPHMLVSQPRGVVLPYTPVPALTRAAESI